MGRARHRFRSRIEGMNQAVRSWACRSCHAIVEDKPHPVPAKAKCQACGAVGFWHLASKAERRRFAELSLLVRAGKIERLECQRSFDLVVNGVHVTRYVADFVYVRGGKTVIEDVKAPRFQTDLSKLKIALFDALNRPHGLQVRLVRR